MRFLTKIFAAFDIVSTFLLFLPTWNLATHIEDVPNNFLSQARVWLTFPLFFSLVASAAGLMFFKKFGFITYYIQFPFRLILWVFSIGFITLLPEWLNLSNGWFDAFFRVCIVAEFFRVYYSVKIYWRYF